MGFILGDCFFVFFLCAPKSHLSRVGYKSESFFVTLRLILSIPGNRENWIWRASVWHLFGIIVEGYFLKILFLFYFRDILESPLGVCLGTVFVFFFWFVHMGCKRGVLGRQK